MNKYFFIFLIILISTISGWGSSEAIKIDNLQNTGDQLQPPQGIPINNNPGVNLSAENVLMGDSDQKTQQSKENKPTVSQTQPPQAGRINWILYISIAIVIIVIIFFTLAILA